MVEFFLMGTRMRRGFWIMKEIVTTALAKGGREEFSGITMTAITMMNKKMAVAVR